MRTLALCTLLLALSATPRPAAEPGPLPVVPLLPEAPHVGGPLDPGNGNQSSGHRGPSLAEALPPGGASPAEVRTRIVAEMVAAQVNGVASWYCGHGSPCTRGYGPSDLVAAIDRKDAPWRKGDRVLVRHGDRSVVVEVVDVCGCPGRRVIDLTSGAFSRLAPLGRGVIAVTLEPVPDTSKEEAP